MGVENLGKDKRFIEIMNNYSEVYTTILKIYNWNVKDNNLTNLDKEILNFSYI